MTRDRRILLLGADGQVGKALQRALPEVGVVEAWGRRQADLEAPDALRARIRCFAPDVIVNAAAYTAVDKSESNEAQAHAVNAIAPGAIAQEARALGALFVHYSTDYVFDGTRAGPYDETDPVNPLGAYGRTKLEGERAIAAAGCRHLIFRTSWVYGNEGVNFMKTMLRLAGERDHIRVVADQIGAPTSSDAIAHATARCLGAPPASPETGTEPLCGVYHMTCGGETSWYGFACAVFETFLGKDAISRLRIEPIATADYPTPAKRPRNSVLSNAKLLRDFGVALPGWREALNQVHAQAIA